MLPSQRRGLANPGLNLLNRLRLDGWELSVTLGEGFQNLDLKEQLCSRIDGPLTGITPLLGRYQPRRIQARAARRSGRAAQRLPRLPQSRLALAHPILRSGRRVAVSLELIGVEKGAVVYMTSGEIRWVHRNPSIEGKNLV